MADHDDRGHLDDDQTLESGWRRALLAVRVVHPAPSLLVTLAVAVVSYGAGAAGMTAALLAAGLTWSFTRRVREAGWLFLAAGLVPLAAAWVSG